MLIVNQKQTAVFTLEKVNSIFIDGNFIQVATDDTTGYIARYETEERCIEVLKELIDKYPLSNTFTFPKQ